MNISQLLYLSPDFPENYQSFIRRLKDCGVEIFGAGEADFFAMPEDIRRCMTWYERGDLRSADGIRHILGRISRACPHIGRDRSLVVESHNEYWLPAEAMINEIWDLQGPISDTLQSWRRKSGMKSLFEGAGIKCARGVRIWDCEDLNGFVQEAGFPLVLKPDCGVGACGVMKVNNQQQLTEALERIKDQDYFIEQWLEGQMVTYDGLTDRDGRVIFESSLIYGDGIMEYVNQGSDPSFYVSRNIPDQLRELGRKTVNLFGIRRKFFHLEFFRIPTGGQKGRNNDDFGDNSGDDSGDTSFEYWAVEANCRPPGGPIIDMMNYSADIDLYRAYAQVIAGNNLDIAPAGQHSSAADDLDSGAEMDEEALISLPDKKHYCAYMGRRDWRQYRLNHDQVMERHGQHIVSAHRHPEVFSRAMGDYFYIARSPDIQHLQRIIQDIMAEG